MRHDLHARSIRWDFCSQRPRSRALEPSLIRFFFHPEQCFPLTNSSIIPPNHPNSSEPYHPNGAKDPTWDQLAHRQIETIQIHAPGNSSTWDVPFKKELQLHWDGGACMLCNAPNHKANYSFSILCEVSIIGTPTEKIQMKKQAGLKRFNTTQDHWTW